MWPMVAGIQRNLAARNEEQTLPRTHRAKGRESSRRASRKCHGARSSKSFVDLRSRAPERREIPPEYFIVTDDRIVLLNEDKIDNAVRVVSLMEKSPEFEPTSVYGITG